MEYEVIENKTLADEIVELYGGYHALTFEDVMSYRAYNHGIPKDKLFLEAKRWFGNRGVTESTFYLDSQFGLVIDLRTTSDKNLFGNGKKMRARSASRRKKRARSASRSRKNPRKARWPVTSSCCPTVLRSSRVQI